jgi:aspartate aminotransferase
LVRRALGELYTPELLDASTQCDYQPPDGYPPLVTLLEKRHPGTSVIITSGAKQGLSAVFYAMKEMGFVGVAMRAPYWSQMPEAIRIAGLRFILNDDPVGGYAYLMVSPNNPDGYIVPTIEALEKYKRCKKLSVPLIHDAVYYNPIFVPGDLQELADISIFSASKTYGLSGLRVGYITTAHPEVKRLVCEYIEATTVGVSVLSQRVLHDILEQENKCPAIRELFIQRAQDALKEAKKTVAGLSPKVLETEGVEQSTGMFGWFKKGPRFNADKARVAVAPGAAFGDESRIRINLAVEPRLLREAVRRLNSI